MCLLRNTNMPLKMTSVGQKIKSWFCTVACVCVCTLRMRWCVYIHKIVHVFLLCTQYGTVVLCKVLFLLFPSPGKALSAGGWAELHQRPFKERDLPDHYLHQNLWEECQEVTVGSSHLTHSHTLTVTSLHFDNIFTHQTHDTFFFSC